MGAQEERGAPLRRQGGLLRMRIPGSRILSALLISGPLPRSETCGRLSLHSLCQKRGKAWIESGPFLALELPASLSLGSGQMGDESAFPGLLKPS